MDLECKSPTAEVWGGGDCGILIGWFVYESCAFVGHSFVISSMNI